jgi:hypothetical protein
MVRVAGSKLGYVRPNLGRGIFGPVIGPYPALSKVTRVLNAVQAVGDSAPDVTALNGSRLEILQRSPGTDVGSPIVTNLDLSRANLVANVGDWNRDGHGDVVYRETSGMLYLTLGSGTGTFAGRYALGNFGAATTIAGPGDMNGDGRMDLVATFAGTSRLYPGNGATGLAGQVTIFGGIPGQTAVAAGPWNADAAPDLLVRNGSALVLYAGNGAKRVSAPRTISNALAPYDWVVGVGSLAVTGRSDLVARSRTDGSLYALRSNADGSLQPPKLLGSGFGGYDLAG